MKIGSTDISAAYIGSTAINKVYIGSTEVWSSFTGLLDTYTGAAAAYSLRRLRSGYTGYAIKVRRASDNTEQDIGFSNNELDTTTLTSFCSGTDGFVTTWYDQSGNGYDATQTTAANQPQIVSGGSLITENGKVSIEFDGVSTSLINIAGASDLSNVSMFLTVGISQTNDDATIFAYPEIGLNGGIAIGQGDLGTSAEIGLRYRISGSDKDIDGITLTTGQKLFSALCTSSTTAELFEDGIAGTLNTSARLSFNYTEIGGSGAGTRIFDGTIQEVIVYESNESANRTGIETNINDYYSIY